MLKHFRKLKIPLPKPRKPFVHVRGPICVSGPNEQISSQQLIFSSSALKIHAISGYVSVLYLVEVSKDQTSSNPPPGKENCSTPGSSFSSFHLLDAGMPGDFSRIQFYLNDVLKNEGNKNGSNLPPAVNSVVVTHCHPDHCGAADQYHAAGIPVVVPAGAREFFTGPDRKLKYTLPLMDLLFASGLGRDRAEWPFFPGTFATEAKAPFLSDGMSVPFLSDWNAIHIPGHTGHMHALWHSGTRTFYAADLLFRHPVTKTFRSPYPIDIPDAFRRSIARVRHLPVRYLLLAHGGIVDVDDIAGGWLEILDETQEHFETIQRKGSALSQLTNSITHAAGEAKRFSAMPPSRLPPLPPPGDSAGFELK